MPSSRKRSQRPLQQPMSRDWCTSLLTRKLSPREIQHNLRQLEEFARAQFPASGCFSLDWLAEVLVRIDQLWFDRRLLPGIYHAYGGLHLYLDDSEERVAGYVKETADQQTLSLHMNRELFASLFQRQERGYHSGGLLCPDRLVCALHVIVHEAVHLALTLCDKLGYRPDLRDHGKEFNRIVKNLFGHTDAQHGLIPGYEQRHDLVTIRQSLRPGSRAEVFVDGAWTPCTVERKGHRWIGVVTDRNRRLTVHAGLLRLVEPTSSDATS